MNIILVALLSVSMWATAAAQNAVPDVSPSIVQVASFGFWQDGSQQGVYRAIVENQGFEHVDSRLWLEWVAEPVNAQGSPQVVGKVEVIEIRGWSVLVEPAQPALVQGTIRVAATNPHSLERRVFTIELSSVGKYRVVSQ